MSNPFQSQFHPLTNNGNNMTSSQATSIGSPRINSGANVSPYFSPISLQPITNSNNKNNNEIPPLSLDKELEDRRCWICFGDDTDSLGNWVKPCNCSLISHEECLLTWIVENQKGATHKKVHCPQCNEVYRLSDPPSFLVDLFTKIDGIIQSTVPYITLVGLTGSILVTSTTYGAYAVLTICGSEEGERLLGSPNPWGWRVWLGLPLIPWVLIGSRGTYLDSIMPLLPILVLGNDQLNFTFPPSPSLVISILPWIRLIYNSTWNYFILPLEKKWKQQIRSQLTLTNEVNNNNNGLNNNEEEELNEDNQDGVLELEWEVHLGNPSQTRLINRRDSGDAMAYALGERKDIARTVVGALLLPAISSMAGNLLSYIPFIKNRLLPDTFLRSIVGGCLFIFLKDITNLIYKYHLMRKLRKRTILNANPNFNNRS